MSHLFVGAGLLLAAAWFGLMLAPPFTRRRDGGALTDSLLRIPTAVRFVTFGLGAVGVFPFLAAFHALRYVAAVEGGAGIAAWLVLVPLQLGTGWLTFLGPRWAFEESRRRRGRGMVSPVPVPAERRVGVASFAALPERLAAAGLAVSVVDLEGCRVVVGQVSVFRWRWMATRVNISVALVDLPASSGRSFGDRLGDVDAWEASVDGQRRRQFQTGRAVVVVLFGDGADEAVIRSAVADTRAVIGGVLRLVYGVIAPDGRYLEAALPFAGRMYVEFISALVRRVLDVRPND